MEECHHAVASDLDARPPAPSSPPVVGGDAPTGRGTQEAAAGTQRGWLHPVAMTVFGGVDPKPNAVNRPATSATGRPSDAGADHLASLTTT